ncbi:N-acetylneuraminate synthase [Rhodothalassium salexigens DSM 2132]|uniref:N-acetylneuraminate synthase n=1 Tax=Rhodothalassium salexigens DSM 2132 TaxID=1188247 RepID=A0A4R2P822_RHOSA|nr:pseudaminic acid synthase [Rhodothalassium salexigens]MBB4212736.1 N-acetylneuraminate synthase [Rhodothalassium salexigens DSM 2132]MBK1639239.1 pseudaminic acid synthase [Rhodothalassium salexigens DSM 2132]TCP30161.1 N-acetylneuraminate synthase [Rhodothalassium salexigens DSM 2132]
MTDTPAAPEPSAPAPSVTAPIAAVTIAGRPVGPGHPPFLIAEMSANHGRDLGRALAMIDAFAEAGADAVKLQTFTPDTMTLDHRGPGFVVEGGLWHGRTLYDLYGEGSLPWDWHAALFERAAARGVILFSAPFDASAVALLADLDAPAYKIASFELVDTPLIEAAAAQGKPLILSTGHASADDIDRALAAARRTGSGEIVLLHCVSGYPTPVDQANVSTIPHLARTYGVPAGLSDHTLGLGAAVAAVALGAVAVEKHVTLSRDLDTLDAAFSLEPAEFAQLAQACRDAHAALGQPTLSPQASEAASAAHRRSLYVTTEVAKGTVLGPDHVRSIRPGHGLAPRHLARVLGQKAARNLHKGEPMRWDMLAPDAD